MLCPMINANCLCSFGSIEGVLLVLDVSSLTSSYFVIFEGFRLIAFAASFRVFLFLSISCVLLHCIVFSVVYLYMFLVISIAYFGLLLSLVFLHLTVHSQDLALSKKIDFAVIVAFRSE